MPFSDAGLIYRCERERGNVNKVRSGNHERFANYLHITSTPMIATMKLSKIATGTKMPTVVAKESSPLCTGTSSDPPPPGVL